MTSSALPPIGRVRLSDIAGDWSRTQALNPRLLASEVAGVLRAIAPDGQPLEGHHYSLTMFDLATGAGGLTYGALADYFDALGSEQPSTSIQTTTGPTPAGAVLLAQTFAGRLVIDATQRAATAAGFVVELLPGPAISRGAQRQTFQSEPPPGSSPEVLAAHQVQLRQEGEQSAGEQLEAERADRQRLEAENTKLSARLTAMAAQLQQAQEDAEQDRRDLEEERRTRTKWADQIQEHAGIIAFMDATNPLSPVEGRRLVTAWCELTENGTKDVVTEHGIGLQEQCRRWLAKNFGAPAEVVVKRFVWALAWPARKKGGMVAKRSVEKG